MHQTSSNYRAKHMVLFDFLRKQSDYNEAAAKTIFKGQKTADQFHVLKNYLLHAILKSLRNYNASSAKQIEVNDILTNIEILFQKELFDMCSEEIRRGLRVARKYYLTGSEWHLINWQRKIFLRQMSSNLAGITSTNDAQARCLKDMADSLFYWEETSKVFDLNPGDEKVVDQNIIPDEVPTHLANAVMHYNLLFTSRIIAGQSKEANSALQKSISLLEKYPCFIEENPNTYITLLNNQVGSYIFQGRYDDVPDKLHQIRQVVTKYNIKNKGSLATRLSLRTYNIELEMYRDLKQYEKAHKLIRVIEKFLVDNDRAVSDEYRILFYYQFSVVYFFTQRYGDVLNWINAILQKKWSSERTDLITYSRLLALMTHFELDNIILLKYALESFRRFLRKRKKITGLEKILVAFFSKLCRAPVSDRKDLFRDLYNELFQQNLSMISKSELDYIDLRTWTENHLHG